MNELVYPRERTLSAMTLILGSLVWIALIAALLRGGLLVDKLAGAMFVLVFGFLAYLFAHSALIAHIKGNGVQLSETQFPDLYAQFAACCNRLQLKRLPEAYVLNGNGALNAFATKFLGSQYVVLLSDVIDAMDGHADGVSFYVGHELGHLRMKHLSRLFLRWPVLWLPLLGAAYSRAKESTCDRHGLACSSSPDGAAHALAALAAGGKRWKKLDSAAYLKQTKRAVGFWMSFHELVAGYPWLTKRFARVMDTAAPLPRRNPFAYLVALFVPYAGRLGPGFGFLVLVYIVGVLAAIAIPAYSEYTIRAKMEAVVVESQGTRDALARYYESSKKIPESLEIAGTTATLPDGSHMSLDSRHMVLTVATARGELVFVPKTDAEGHVVWSCTNGARLKPTQVPASCRAK
jgi:Zn-dependent protease with chaperone function/Tfp pilus assembly major pilin PilA